MQRVVNGFNQVLVKKIDNIANNTSVKALPVKPDVFSMSPSVKASVKQQIKKFDNPNVFQKACRFVSKTKVGKALVFGAMAVAAAIVGKVSADKVAEEK